MRHDTSLKSHAQPPSMEILLVLAALHPQGPRSGWLRSVMEFFGVGKQQELASILAASAVKAATPVGRRDTDRRRPL